MQEDSRSKGSVLNKALSVLRRFWGMHESGIIVIVVLYVTFVQFMNPVFLSSTNVNNFLRQACYILIPAIGMTLVIISGGLDLSVGSVMAVSGMFAGFSMTTFGLPIIVSIGVGLATGILVGLLNGSIIVRFTVPPMIITLGMMYIARGISLVSTRGAAIYPLPAAFQALEQGRIFGLPAVVPFTFVVCVIFHIILTQTTFGRSVYAIGGNRETAKLSGIRVKRISLMTYAICGMMAALAGLVISSRLGSAQPNTGMGHELQVIAACIIGGTSTYGGRGTILGTAIGALFISILTNSMTLMRVNVNFQMLVTGIILVFAVILDQYKREVAQKRAVKSA